MLRYLGRRLLMMVPLLVGITIITFIVIHLAPGNPVEVAVEMNPKASAQARENLRRLYGLDKPWPVATPMANISPKTRTQNLVIC
jgi:peptide/nickel transport system permease protein